MRKPRGKRTGLIIMILVGTVILGGIGIYIGYMIYQARQVSPEESRAATCCVCEITPVEEAIPREEDTRTINEENPEEESRSSGDEDSRSGGDVEHPVILVRGFTDDTGVCRFRDPVMLHDSPLLFCQNLVIDGKTLYTAVKKSEIPCNSGCRTLLVSEEYSRSSGGDVTVTAIFDLIYAIAPNDRIQEVELTFTRPEGEYSLHSTESISAKIDESGETDNPNVTVTITETPEGGNTIKTYKVDFITQWEDILSDTAGAYKLSARARNMADEWTDTSTCTLTHTVTEPATGEFSCRFDLAPIFKKDDKYTIDLTSIVTFPPDIPREMTTYSWGIDSNCNQTIEDPAEIITTDSPTLRDQVFTYPEGQTGNATCPIELNIQISVDGGQPITTTCNGKVTLSLPSASCGNGSCESGETCDPNGNISCLVSSREQPLPSGQTCREDCTFCGDGILDNGEECDPGIPEGGTGYDPDCSESCTIGGAPQPEPEPEPSPGVSFSAAVTPSATCVERVAPNNTVTLTITVTNSGSTAGTVRAISDTLPQGFSYQTGSSTINGAPNPGDTGVTVESSGESQLITWTNGDSGWTVPENGGTLTVLFTAVVGGNAVTGSQTNRITVTPADANPISGECAILVAQTCTQPDTGILDNKFSIILISTALLVIAGAAYYTGFGTKPLLNFFKKAETAMNFAEETKDDIMLRISKPQKHLEKSIEETALKKIESHIHGEKKRKKP